MFNTSVLGSFHRSDDAQKIATSLIASPPVVPGLVSIGTTCGDSYSNGKERHLITLLGIGVALGTIVGAGSACAVWMNVMAFGSLAAAAISYGAFGGAAGLLIAGLFDVVHGGSLDDRLDVKEDSLFTVSTMVNVTEEANIEQLMFDGGANSVYNIVQDPNLQKIRMNTSWG